MDNDRQQAIAAVDFTGRWAVRGYEKGKNLEFWLELLVDVLRVTIEQKSLGKDLRKPLLQCDGAMMGLLSAGSGEGLMALGSSLKTGAKLAVQSVIGGTLSELGGGNFANGAITAAFSFMFNHTMHERQMQEQKIENGSKLSYSEALDGYKLGNGMANTADADNLDWSLFINPIRKLNTLC